MGRLDRMQASDHLPDNTGPGKEVQLPSSDLRFVKTWKRDCPKIEAEARGPVRELLQWSSKGFEQGRDHHLRSRNPGARRKSKGILRQPNHCQPNYKAMISPGSASL